jgi:hypothetical protein
MTRRNQGVTLIEAVLFVAIALSLIVGGLVFFQQATTASRTQQTVRLVQSLVVEARAQLRNSGGFVDETVLIASGAVPSGAIDPDGGGIVSPWGSTIDVDAGMTIHVTPGPDGTPGGGSPVEIEQIDIILRNTPFDVCSRLAVFDEDGNGVLGHGIVLIFVIGGSGDPVYSGLAYAFNHLHPSIPAEGLSPGLAGSFCRAGPGSGADLLVWYASRG